MAAMQLSLLPQELICQIFEAADSLHTVCTLARVSRIFNDTWKLYTTSICHEVLSHSLSHFTEAQELAKIQDRLAARLSRRHEGEGEDEEDEEDEEVEEVEEEEGREEACEYQESSLARAQRLLANDITVGRVCDFFIAEFIARNVTPASFSLQRIRPPYLSPAERARFERAYYLLWTCAISEGLDSGRVPDEPGQGQSRVQSSLVATLSLRELWRMRQIADFANGAYNRRFRYRRLHLAPEALRLFEQIELGVRDWWGKTRRMMKHIAIAELHRRGGTMPTGPGHLPEGCVALFDEYQHYVEHLPDTV